MYIKRNLAAACKEYQKFPVVAVLGPRQAGKTTLAQQVFKKHQFVSLEDPEQRDFAQRDPRRFLKEMENAHGIIIDEFQYVPSLLSYIKLEVDAKKRPGYFIITGSQNFPELQAKSAIAAAQTTSNKSDNGRRRIMNQAITQSLAGRVGILTLLPFSLKELLDNNLAPDIDQVLLHGSYPRIYDEKLLPNKFYPSYIHTYIERDVRELATVGNLLTFQKFMQLCAGRVGQLLNISDLAVSCGITRLTAESWLSVLEASYIIFLLRPHFNNFNKRLTKTPKLYFYDTGLACSLLGIRSTKELSASLFRGHLFESLIIADLYKQYLNAGEPAPLYFWRDQNGRIEIDCIIDRSGVLTPIEIKSGETIVSDYFTGLTNFKELAKTASQPGYIIYGGDSEQNRSAGHVIGWQRASTLIKTIDK